VKSTSLSPLLSVFVAFIGVTLVYLGWQTYRDVGILVEWSTASELETAGFNLYRSLSPEGPFEKVNQELIPASDSPLTGGSYEYRDTDVRPGKVYYYNLEEVELNGGTNLHGPIEVRAAPNHLIGAAEALLGLFALVTAGLNTVRQLSSSEPSN
jgi:hypothetical protein